MHPQSPENEYTNTPHNPWTQDTPDPVTPHHQAQYHPTPPQPAHISQSFHPQQQPEPAQPVPPQPQPQYMTPPIQQPVRQSLDRAESDPVTPTPVVQVLSPRGVEYVMLAFALFTTAIGLATTLVCLVYGQTSMMSLSLPVALMIVGLPIFAGLFLRLKKAELRNPNLKLDQSKRRSTQATQIIAFLISLFTLIGIVVSIFAAMSGEGEGIGKALGSAFLVLIVFGGILAYYWHDEHKA
jgi:hypothetical protein